MRLSHLTALAVLVALVGAMFAVAASAQTAPAITSSTDSDFTIAEGGNITVTVENVDTVADWTFQPVFGLVLTQEAGVATYTHPSGARTGDFTIRATHATLPALTKTLTVGDPGVNLATVEVVLGTTNADGDAHGTGADGDKQETDTAPSGTDEADTLIFIRAVAKNSLGNASNVSTGATTQLSVTVFAVGGLVGSEATRGTTSSATGTSENSNEVNFVVSSPNPERVEVFATATIGTSSVRSTENLILNFSGGPDMISAGDASGGLLAPATAGAANTGVVSFEVTAVDKAGATNSAANEDTDANLLLDPADISTGLEITNADDEDVTAKFAVNYSAKGDTNEASVPGTLGSTAIDETKISDNAIAVVITPGPAPGVPGGTYTATVTLDEGSKNSVEVEFHVVGKLDSLTAMADPMIVAADGEFTVTATLLDANGLPVADGKADVEADPDATPAVAAVDNSSDDVVFSVIGGDLAIYGDGADSDSKGQTVTQEVMGGKAMATFYVTGDAGKAIVLVTAGGKTARVTVTAEAPVVDPEPDPTLPTVTISGGSAVTEGDHVMFTISVDQVLPSALTVSYVVDNAAGSDFVNVPNGGFSYTATIASGRTSVDIWWSTVNDSVVEDDGHVTVTLSTDERYEIGTPAMAAVAVNDNDPESVGVECLSHTSAFSTWTCDESTTLGEIHMSLSSPTAVSVYDRATSAWVSYTGGFGSAPASTTVMQYATIYITE